MRLIDADKLIECILNTPTKSDFSKPLIDELCNRQFEILDIIDEQPTVNPFDYVKEMDKQKEMVKQMKFNKRICGKYNKTRR